MFLPRLPTDVDFSVRSLTADRGWAPEPAISALNTSIYEVEVH